MSGEAFEQVNERGGDDPIRPIEPGPPGASAASPSLPPTRPRFCRGCGAEWQPDWERCGACAPAGGVVATDGGRVTGTGAHRPLTRALGLYFMLLGLSVVGILFVHAGIPELQIDFALTIGFALVVLAWCVVAPGRLVPALRKLVSPLWFVWGSGTALATFAVAYAVIGALQSLTNLPTERMSDVYLENGYGWGMVVLMVCVHPALFEELAFRGVVLDALQPVLSTTEAVLVSSMMFMILHLSPAMFPHTFAMGLGAGLLRVWSGSLLPGMLLHFIHNLLCVVVEAYGWF